jgi:hypothetical protein
MSSATLITTSQTLSAWQPTLIPGPEWRSFDQFRNAGPAALDGISLQSVGTLNTKLHTFRILRDEDFQKLIGLASEIHRLRGGIAIAIQAAKVAVKHPNDPDTMQLFWQSVSFLNESNLLPERDGHGKIEIASDGAEDDDDTFDITVDNIPRPRTRE